ncbi:radical SAM family heme chaperone HemW [Ottowia sp.]|uniref:radical SAM family heme chaperone HemW n=1 Tax=Ottowia sp. TaxID=1898956 RepID=UPI002B9CA65B|nr:oxygen-independent coproporphyrinogen III oxidase-like protein [Pseudomonadota bacterium]HOV18646.1 radical SAM family heme chaperone HemW [Ottowia sp.]
MDVAGLMGPGLLQLPALPPLSLYVHLPWCIRKCPYCDFNSHALRPEVDADAQERRYVDALLADLEASLPLIWGRPVVSVFFGGGTPSLFAPESIERLIEGIRARLPLAPACEITLEANPGTFERARFAAFRSAGVTRLSVGVQSFNDAHLKALGRVHDGAQARAALEEAARAFDTFNLDLMYALPGQSLAELEQDVRSALAFAPPHLSIYHLTIEPNTVFAKHPPRLPEEDVAWDMLDRITELTGHAGMTRYEVSAYARAGHRCVHNLNYWSFGDYLGIGAGAHGKLSFAHRIVRQERYRLPERYMQQALAGDAVARTHEVAPSELPFEFMLNALRLKGGFALQDFGDRTGLPIDRLTESLRQAESKGWLERVGEGVRPTERGFDFLSDLQQLFLPPA